MMDDKAADKLNDGNNAALLEKHHSQKGFNNICKHRIAVLAIHSRQKSPAYPELRCSLRPREVSANFDTSIVNGSAGLVWQMGHEHLPHRHPQNAVPNKLKPLVALCIHPCFALVRKGQFDQGLVDKANVQGSLKVVEEVVESSEAVDLTQYTNQVKRHIVHSSSNARRHFAKLRHVVLNMAAILGSGCQHRLLFILDDNGMFWFVPIMINEGMAEVRHIGLGCQGPFYPMHWNDLPLIGTDDVHHGVV
mmetsp:Transcript_44627/g.72661  ORF Transcript_44627/g.72661 Transcript_44627/m.72661 type:complete len:249 (+) Transcript_44627:1658-2404(+)